MDFDVIPYHDIVWGHRLGAGSFGSVFKGQYLGIDIAIKEVVPSTEYDVRKYFEREWRIMRECRHPNIVLFLGLCKAPEGDGRVFIVSEYIPRGNLRHFILSSHPFPWRLRLSFATDVARAVAYLHARQCIHRDLKGENLLITSNERVKVTDFGFARITSRSADEMRRMTYCGTDGYMSPEIIMGDVFDLPTDVFSLGIILIEIMSRRLVDSKTFTRGAPTFVPDPNEVRRRVSSGCPPALIDLALSCCQFEPSVRPKMPEVLSRLREIELSVLHRIIDTLTSPAEGGGGEHVGSVKLLRHGGKRAMPIFDRSLSGEMATAMATPPTDDEEDEEVLERAAVMALAKAEINVNGSDAKVAGDTTASLWRTARWDDTTPNMSTYATASEMRGRQPLLAASQVIESVHATDGSRYIYSTNVVRGTKPVQTASAFRDAIPFRAAPESLSSVMTIRPGGSIRSGVADDGVVREAEDVAVSPVGAIVEIHTVIPSVIHLEHVGAVQSQGLGTHRFTLVNKDSAAIVHGKRMPSTSVYLATNFAFAFLPRAFAPSTGVKDKCPVCHKRLGQRPALQCDDCGTIVHVKCSHSAPRNCVEFPISI